MATCTILPDMPAGLTSSISEVVSPNSLSNSGVAKTAEFTDTSPVIPTVSRLLVLPLELQQHIYSDVFHEALGGCVPCNVTDVTLGNRGCLCGEGLSLTNRKLYSETRGLFFKCAGFDFPDPASCKRHLDKIGQHVASLGILSISYKNTYEQSEELNDIFHKFQPECSLHSLRLQITSSRSSRVLPPAPPPIYLPIARKRFPAQFYDLSWRPTRRPLAELVTIRSLVIVGCPGIGEVEEAIFQLSLKIEKQAAEQGKMVKISEGRHGSDWFYKLEVRSLAEDRSLAETMLP